MAKQENGRLHEFNLAGEIFSSMAALLIFGMLFGVVINIVMVIMGNPGNMNTWVILCMLIFAGIGIAYSFKLRKFDKEFGLRDNNKYSIDKVKDYFGAPVDILEDKDCSYYTFYEDVAGMLARVHTFTTDKKGVVIKHELSFIGNNKKD